VVHFTPEWVVHFAPEWVVHYERNHHIIVQNVSNEFLTYFVQLGDIHHLNRLGSGSLSPSATSSTTKTTEIPINLQPIKDARYASPSQPLRIAFIAANEVSEGIYVSNVQLKIYYWETPNAPTNVQKVGDATATTCSLKWTASTVGPAKYYDIYDGTTVVKSDIPATSNPNVNLTGLTPGKSYVFSIKAKNPAGTSSYSTSTLSVTLPNTPPVLTSSWILFCTTTPPKTFSAANWQQDDYYWVSSSNISLSSPNTNSSVTVTANGTGSGWVSIKNSSGKELLRSPVWMGKPVVDYINGPSYIQCGWGQSFSAVLESSFSDPYTYHWELSPSSGNYYWSQYGDPYVNIIFYDPSPTTYSFSVVATNICGTSVPAYTYFSIGSRGGPSSPVFAYPNPVDDILTVELDAFAAAFPPVQSPSRSFLINPSFDVRLLDIQGNILRQQKANGGAVQFNVSNLPDGIYYLHIYEGVNTTPEIQQIMVQH